MSKTTVILPEPPLTTETPAVKPKKAKIKRESGGRHVTKIDSEAAQADIRQLHDDLMIASQKEPAIGTVNNMTDVVFSGDPAGRDIGEYSFDWLGNNDPATTFARFMDNAEWSKPPDLWEVVRRVGDGSGDFRVKVVLTWNK